MKKQDKDFVSLIVSNNMSKFKDILKSKPDLLSMIKKEFQRIEKKTKVHKK